MKLGEFEKYLLDQLAPLGDVDIRIVFNSPCVYVWGKVVGWVGGEQLFIKATEAGKALLGADEPTYSDVPGSMPLYLVDPEDQEAMLELIRVSWPEIDYPASYHGKRRAKLGGN